MFPVPGILALLFPNQRGSRGRTILPGTDASEFTIEYVTGYGQPIQRGSVTVIPEPATVVMLASGLLGLLLLWRRRRQA